MAKIRKLNYQHRLYFWSVVRAGSLARASEDRALSPPTISAQLRTRAARLGEELLTKSGRTLVPTDAGRLVYSYADEIFGLGRDLVDALEHRPTSRPLRFAIGIDDVVPKEIAHRLIEPAFSLDRPVRIGCREGTRERLVADLAAGELDIVLSDAPVTPMLNVRARSVLLGVYAECWMAAGVVADKLRRGFPKSLQGAPVLLPTDDTAIRRELDRWFERQDIRPVVVGEFEDYALMREFAHAGRGFMPVPEVLAKPFRDRHGFRAIGPATGVESEFFAITVDRKRKHPAVASIVGDASASLEKRTARGGR
jgi:LysR family transcriptional activator of nhaA